MPKKEKSLSRREKKSVQYAIGAVEAAMAEDGADPSYAPLPDRPADELTPQEIIADAIDEEELALWAETEKLNRFAAKPLLRMFLWAYAHRRSRLAVNIATFNWGLSAGNMARAVTRHQEYFDGRKRPSAHDLRMLSVLGQLNAAEDRYFYQVWQDNQSLLPWEMQRLVTLHKRKNAKPKPKKIRARGRAIHKGRAGTAETVEIVSDARGAFAEVVEGANYKVLLAPDTRSASNGNPEK